MTLAASEDKKPFCAKLRATFCKLDRFVDATVYFASPKRSSFEKDIFVGSIRADGNSLNSSENYISQIFSIYSHF
jgi:hypothetical protein